MAALDLTTINTTTFVLRDASNKIVPATVSYTRRHRHAEAQRGAD